MKKLGTKVFTWTELPSLEKDNMRVFSGACEGMVILCVQVKGPYGNCEHMATATLNALIVKLPEPMAAKAWKMAEHDANNQGSTSNEGGFSA